MRVLLLALFLLGCGSEAKVPAAVQDTDLERLISVYFHDISQVQDEHGFIYTDECDSLLFTALAGTVLDTVDIRAARESNGRWHRRPTKDCYPDHSKSTISRDMLLGVMWYAYAHDDLELVENMWAYGSQRSWIMGDGLRSRVQLTPGLVATLAQLIKYLGGADHVERHIPTIGWARVGDFEAHLQVLHILLRLRVYGNIDVQAEQRLQEHAERQPSNALFRYAAGDVSEAASLLKAQFPMDRLPTSEDHCARWLYERDEGDDWKPCSKGEKHSGGEVLFVGALLLKG